MSVCDSPTFFEQDILFLPIKGVMLLIMKCKNRKYYKIPKFLDTPKIAVIILKFEQCGSSIE